MKVSLADILRDDRRAAPRRIMNNEIIIHLAKTNQTHPRNRDPVIVIENRIIKDNRRGPVGLRKIAYFCRSW